MSFLDKLFKKKEEQIHTNTDFWNWFLAHEKTFYEVVKKCNNIEKNFFNKLAPKLNELKDGFWYITGMFDDSTAELILTSDGVIKNIIFVEELIDDAPQLPNWKFTALKPALNITDVDITMDNYTFNRENISFYPIENKNYPDEVDIVVVHDDFNEKDKNTIINGVYIFIDNYLGELNAVTSIDNLTIISKKQAEQELIPIEKLKAYLIWREKEFVEKYNGTHYNTENDSYSSLEATLKNKLPLIAIVNSTLLEWDSKASHPWILSIKAKYDGSKNNGLPNDETYQKLNDFEEEIMAELKDIDGYLNVGRETADSERIIYFACKDFRKPSKLLHNLSKKHLGKIDFTYDIYKDKYWQSLERFSPN